MPLRLCEAAESFAPSFFTEKEELYREWNELLPAFDEIYGSRKYSSAIGRLTFQ